MLPAIFNPEDKVALELALQIKDEHGAHVVAMTMGPPKASEVLRECLYMGADEAILISDRKFAGADMVGANCGHGIEQMVPIARAMKEADPSMPLLIQANAGEPHIQGDKTVFDETPDVTASFVPQLMELGVEVIGGCCGTTPDHIREIKRKIEEFNAG
jgi:methionine synthase I (cobalamin-dependent)